MKLRRAAVCVGWRLSEEEPPPDSEAPPGNEWTERSVRTRRERSGRNLKGMQGGSGRNVVKHNVIMSLKGFPHLEFIFFGQNQ